ncbi:MAG: PAS domain S-box protein [Acidobacteriota bacterium]
MSEIEPAGSERPSSDSMPTRAAAVKIAVAYGVLGALWILTSGWVLHRFALSQSSLALLEDVKGWFFVAVTALLLGLALDGYFRQIRSSGRLLRKSRERYRRSEEEFRTMFEMASVGIGQADPHTGRLVRVNQKVCAITGYSEAQLLEMHISELTHPDDRQRDREMFERVVRGESAAYRLEKRYIRGDGSVIWVNVNMSVLRDEDGRPLRTMATIEDISDRRQTEQALRENEERFRSTLDNMLEGCQLISFDWRYLYINAAAARQGRSTVGALLGRTMMEAYPGIEDSSMFQSLEECMSARTSKEVKTEFVFPDGSSGWFQLLIQPAAEGLFILSVDITERIRLEAQLRQAQKLEAIGQLAGGVAHDFNNILAAIMMHLGLLKMNTEIGEDTHHALNELEGEANRAASLTRQLLMFSRRSVLAVRPLDMNEALANLLKMLRRLIGEHIELCFDAGDALPLVEADVGMLEQILMNLVVNARDAMPEGGSIKITTGVREIGEGQVREDQARRAGRFVFLSVSDTGCGMSSETMKRIFEPFFTTKEAGRGTGLGLATVHGIVAQHEGWIEVESELGEGSTFRVMLPALEGLQVTTSSATKPVHPVRLGSECILVVEDDESLRRLAARSLESLGYEVYTAANGQEAMMLWQDHEEDIDLVLTDMVMPEGVTGLELAERLQRLKPGISVIVASGYSADMVQSGVPTREGVVYLAKPFRMKMLADVVRECLDRRV